jgi:aminopeptidase N
MISTLLLLLQTAAQHDALHYDITVVTSDTSTHVLEEVQVTWRLGSTKPLTMELDSSMHVIRVLVDGKPNTRLSRTMYGRSTSELDVPHEKQPGDTLSTRVRYRGYPRGGLVLGRNARGERTVYADTRRDQAQYWLPVPENLDDEATVSFHIQVPEGHRVTTDGVLEKIDTLAYGQTVWNYNLDRPMRVYNVKVGWEGGAPLSKPIK